MNALLDGLTVLVNNWQLTTGILVLVAAISLPLHSLKADVLPGSRQRPGLASTSTGILLALFFFFSLLLRLAYVSRALFPSYFDSAQHYAIIKNIMAGASGILPANYYHMGFHFLTAFLASIFQAEITTTMLVLGQVILAVLPLPFFFIVKQETRSNTAAWFALILSAFGWYMPAHAVDWGKYPALLSLGMISLVLSLAYLLSQNRGAKKRWMLYVLLGISILLTVLAHSRALIVFGIVFLAWIIVAWWQKLPQRQQTFIFISVIVMTILEVVCIQRQNVLALLFDPYLHKGVLVTSFVLLGAFFAWTSYPRLTFVCTLTITFLLASLFIPVTWIPGYGNLTLLDRPFVEMILFLPLSLLGGLGVAGLEKKSWGRHIGLLAIGIVAVNAFFTYNLYPSSCCVIVGKDDVVAMDWAANQLPVKARIGISSTELKVLASESFEGIVGSDAGIWVTPLTGRTTITLPYSMDFDQQPALDMLCQNKISHLFVGEVGQTFDNAKLNSRPEWYRPLLAMPVTRVYEVIGCDGL